MSIKKPQHVSYHTEVRHYSCRCHFSLKQTRQEEAPAAVEEQLLNIKHRKSQNSAVESILRASGLGVHTDQKGSPEKR